MNRIEELKKKIRIAERDAAEHEAAMEACWSEVNELEKELKIELAVSQARVMQGVGLRFDSQDAVIITFTRKEHGASIVELCVRNAAGKFYEIRLDYVVENARRFESVPFDESVELFNEFHKAGKI